MSERLSDETLATLREYADKNRGRVMVGFSPSKSLAVIDELIALRAQLERTQDLKMAEWAETMSVHVIETLRAEKGELRDELAAVRAENAKLRAVATAARAMVQRPDIIAMQDFEALADAVAALEVGDD